jgi:hypothetical protein
LRALQVEKPGAGGAVQWKSDGLVFTNLIHPKDGAVNGRVARCRSSGRAKTRAENEDPNTQVGNSRDSDPRTVMWKPARWRALERGSISRPYRT